MPIYMQLWLLHASACIDRRAATGGGGGIWRTMWGLREHNTYWTSIQLLVDCTHGGGARRQRVYTIAA